jgi:hypothetical protein
MRPVASGLTTSSGLFHQFGLSSQDSWEENFHGAEGDINASRDIATEITNCC